MTRIPVESSQIKSIGYDPSTKTLEVEFHARGEKYPESVYHYHEVSPETHANLMKAESKGSHLGKFVKGKHRFTKISPI